MSLARMTMIGIEHYLNAKKLSLFDDIALPQGVEKENVVNAVLLECGELEVLYSDADFFRHAIMSWSNINVANWKKVWTVLNTEYNPLENYDRIEEWTDNSTESKNLVGSTSDKDSGENLAQVSAFNSSEFSNSNKMTTSNSGSSSSNSKSDGTTSTRRSGRAHGNIGVTTSQQMLEAEVEVAKINFYTQIAKEFKTQFCVMIY